MLSYALYSSWLRQGHFCMHWTLKLGGNGRCMEESFGNNRSKGAGLVAAFFFIVWMKYGLSTHFGQRWEHRRLCCHSSKRVSCWWVCCPSALHHLELHDDDISIRSFIQVCDCFIVAIQLKSNHQAFGRVRDDMMTAGVTDVFNDDPYSTTITAMNNSKKAKAIEAIC